MKLAFIAPTKYIEMFSEQGDFHLVLSHLLPDVGEWNEYENAIMNSKLPKILDNGLFENHVPEPLESLVAKAVSIGATHFFVPDHLYNSEATREEVNKAWEFIQKNGLKIKLAAVVQAETKKKWFDLYDVFCKDDRIDLIGLSILAIPKVYNMPITEARIQMMRDMLFLEELGMKHKKSHLLGLGDSYRDVLFAAKNCPWIVSNDTSSPVWNGFQGKRIDSDLNVEGGKTKAPVNFDYRNASKGLDLAQQNINMVLKQCK